LETEALLARPEWQAGRREVVLCATPAGKIPKPEEMTGAALFLASQDAHDVTGTYMIADGGCSVTPMSLGDNGQNTDDVYARVREAILDGELGPGAVMSQVALAGELGISRTPLREALRMLQPERLVEAEPNRRVRVAPMSAADLEELCIARIALEAEAMRLSVPRLTPENLARLEGYMAETAHYARRQGLPALAGSAPQVSSSADRASGRPHQRPGRAAVRPRRALPPAAHRPWPGPVGDRGASRDPRCVRGGGPGPEREPAGQPSGPHRLRGRGAARARL
jgi:hypothetical protein